MAFGMTPIHPPSSSSSSASHPASNHTHHSSNSFSSIASTSTTSTSTSVLGKLSLNPHSVHSTHTSPLHSPPLRPGSPPALHSSGFGFGFTSRGPSRPASRPGSPPITLAPLRLPSSAVGDPSERNIPGIREATDGKIQTQVDAAKPVTPVVNDVEMESEQGEVESAMQVDDSMGNAAITSSSLSKQQGGSNVLPVDAASAPKSHISPPPLSSLQGTPLDSTIRVIQPAPSISPDPNQTTTAQMPPLMVA
ncbi:hypothetical protein FB446DRAFT_50700 [Lentinula raphanica]|nr:hypothetical protein FB446DRAFT_50700 [Lentinula raphanica]